MITNRDYKTISSYKVLSSQMSSKTRRHHSIPYGHLLNPDFPRIYLTSRFVTSTIPSLLEKHDQMGSVIIGDCSFCFSPETLMHVISGCKEYLNEGRFTWRHDSLLNFIASSLTCVKGSKLYVDLPGFITPSVITSDELRPDLLLTIENKLLYILELTVGFETNLKINSDRKLKKYLPLISDQENNFDKVKFVNVSISSLGVFGQSTNTLIDMLKDLKFDEQHIRYVKKKIISTCIRVSYYIFCQRNKDWTSPELLKI